MLYRNGVQITTPHRHERKLPSIQVLHVELLDEEVSQFRRGHDLSPGAGAWGFTPHYIWKTPREPLDGNARHDHYGASAFDLEAQYHLDLGHNEDTRYDLYLVKYRTKHHWIGERLFLVPYQEHEDQWKNDTKSRVLTITLDNVPYLVGPWDHALTRPVHPEREQNDMPDNKEIPALLYRSVRQKTTEEGVPYEHFAIEWMHDVEKDKSFEYAWPDYAISVPIAGKESAEKAINMMHERITSMGAENFKLCVLTQTHLPVGHENRSVLVPLDTSKYSIKDMMRVKLNGEPFQLDESALPKRIIAGGPGEGSGGDINLTTGHTPTCRVTPSVTENTGFTLSGGYSNYIVAQHTNSGWSVEGHPAGGDIDSTRLGIGSESPWSYYSRNPHLTANVGDLYADQKSDRLFVLTGSGTPAAEGNWSVFKTSVDIPDYSEDFQNPPTAPVVKAATGAVGAGLTGAQLAGAYKLNQLAAKVGKKVLVRLGVDVETANAEWLDKTLQAISPFVLYYVCEKFNIPHADVIQRGAEKAMEASTFMLVSQALDMVGDDLFAIQEQAKMFVPSAALAAPPETDVIEEIVQARANVPTPA